MTPERRLEEAIEHHDHAAAERALDRGASVDRADLRGATALEWAVLRRDARMLALVISHTHDIDHIDHGGATALHHAVAVQQPELVQLLLEAGASPSASYVYGSTTYDLALRLGNNRILSMLEDRICGNAIVPTRSQGSGDGEAAVAEYR